MSSVHVVYAHPSPEGFTREVLDAFLGGLTSYTLTDLYATGFEAAMSPAEYSRPAAGPVPGDVAAEQTRLDAADVWAFIYPVWWADCPAILKGWFDRVWTAGWAYKPMRLRVARRAIVLCTAGYPVADLEASGVHRAMRTTMLTDRIGARAESSDFVVLGGAVLRDADPAGWAALKATHLRRATELARSTARPGHTNST
ncbi:NAD(P)H-dependent oxidoreductase [Actinoplanes sp. NEAU-A12]|uniref:NAD(P)H-dependent oxidoreductase n=1 Tax=Actinoplanes sandaracinus TaxID=3045177 RepID=A0ABT6WBB8_9ACTN|nr:NAD(P)H-dependent oxidoreductase [Actinoplanes sandaracinus]MDI6097013.1 NAD(P)H-dependent oxidoreductase [Actinoplanes sandaracinus]